MLFESFTEFFIFFGTGLCFFLTFLEVLKKEKEIPLSSLVYLGIFFGSVQLRIGFVVAGTILKNPYLHIGLVSSILAIGPIILHIGLKITDFVIRKKISLRLHIIPALLGILCDLYFLQLPYDLKLKTVHEVIFEDTISFMKIVYVICISHILFYFLYLAYLFIEIVKEYEIKYTKFVWLILTVPSIGIFFISFGLLAHDFLIFRIGGSILTITVMLVYVFNVRYPTFFITLKADIKQKKYETTLLTVVNVEAVKTRLIELMVEEELYLDDELRLGTLADELKITTHQLSRILNESYEKNFNEFINSYRIEHAKKLLLEDRERSILSVAYEVGFNSKATFNSHFLKMTGITPREFREKNK
ncbi:MAG: helix-turn-helix domain-containing protein [Leptospiraceae bacterium]|nr:helix-turn-helix domain-containing protein [Leptospiraceae bacterium]